MERISERIREQIVDAYVSQVLEQVTKLPKSSRRDRTLQRAVEQIPDVPVPEMVTELLEVPKIIQQDRILQRTVKQAEATQMLQSETSGADGQTYSLFHESSNVAGIDRSRRIRIGDIGQTARRAGAFNCARSAEIAHLCNHEVWCRREGEGFDHGLDQVTVGGFV